MTSEMRRGAVRKISLGTAGFVLVFGAVYGLHSVGVTVRAWALIPLALPGAYAFVGLLELLTGAPFSELSQRWDALHGWQRGVLGVVVVILAFAALALVMIMSDILPRLLKF